MAKSHRGSFDSRCFVVDAVVVVHENYFDQMNGVVAVEASYLKLPLMQQRLRINQLNFHKNIDLNSLKLVIAVVVVVDGDDGALN